jgi:hypothetical protein
MTFLEALNSGKKVKSEYWDGQNRNLDTTLFSDNKVDDFIIGIFIQNATPITWKEIFGNWHFV